MCVCVQRDVRSDPEAVQKVAGAINNLLVSLGSLAVEVSSDPIQQNQRVQRNRVLLLDLSPPCPSH